MENNQITFYETEDGKVHIEVRFENENLWLPQKLLAQLFECSTDNVSLHLRNIYKEKELEENATTEEYSAVQIEGKRKVKRKMTFYSLEVIIAVGYRINSTRGTHFRRWATDKLKNYILKGFAIDSDRFKYGSRFDARYFDELLEEIREIRASERMVYQKITDIFATAIDYSQINQSLCRCRNLAKSQMDVPVVERTNLKTVFKMCSLSLSVTLSNSLSSFSSLYI